MVFDCQQEGGWRYAELGVCQVQYRSSIRGFVVMIDGQQNNESSGAYISLWFPWTLRCGILRHSDVCRVGVCKDR
ncbi:hypothetical protein Mal65_23700 [Crateriforma conspicua]|nr:hypothetical protein Mal65_23700 [Crateriforma conspicua]